MMRNKNLLCPDFWQYARSFLHTYLPKVRNLSPHTVASYKQSMTCYIHHSESQWGVKRQRISFDEFGRKQVKVYPVWMNEVQHFAAKTCNLRLTALKSFMEYSTDETLVANYNEVCSVRGTKECKKTILYMSCEAVDALLKTPKTDMKKGRRDRMMLILLYDTAARAKELVDIRLANLHIIHVKVPFITLTGKGNKSCNVPLMEKTGAHIHQYL